MSTETDSLHLNGNLQVNRRQIVIQDMTDDLRDKMTDILTDRVGDQMTDKMTEGAMADMMIAQKGMIEALETSLLVSPSTSIVIKDDRVRLRSARSMK